MFHTYFAQVFHSTLGFSKIFFAGVLHLIVSVVEDQVLIFRSIARPVWPSEISDK